MRILVDMDGVLADFETGFLRDWRTRNPDLPYVPLEQRTKTFLEDEYPPEAKDDIRDIMTTPGFFRTLPPIYGGAAALQAIHTEGHKVFICTTPFADYKHCVLEKYEWVDRHLGHEWTRRLILTRDKTIIAADILIDDRPSIHGTDTPAWEHVLYDQPYNRHVTGLRRLNWQNWRAVLFAR